MLKDNIKITTLRGPNIDVEAPSTNLFNRFQTRALQNSNKLAVVLDDRSMTYGELYSLVTSFASCLVQVVHPVDIVCQCVERSIEMVTGILIRFLCNTVYCTLSPKDPIERYRALLDETRAKVILVYQAMDHLFSDDNGIDCIKVRIDGQKSIESMLDTMIIQNLASLAFVVFISGSTDTLKDVPIAHANFAYYMASICHENYVLANDIILQTSQDTFDAHLQEILRVIFVGGACILIRSNSGTYLNTAYLTETMCQHQVTFRNLVPSMSIALIDYLNHFKQRFN